MSTTKRRKKALLAAICIVILIVIYVRHQGRTKVKHRRHRDDSPSDVLEVCRKQILTKLAEFHLPTNERQDNKSRLIQFADCEVYRESGKANHPVHFNVLKSSTTVNDPSAITLVTHLTSDRYDRVISIMDTWKGSASISVYVKKKEDVNKFVHKVCFSYLKHRWRNFHLHLVKEDVLLYPYNYLRNIAMDEAQSDFIFITDVDLIPMRNAFESLQHYTRKGRPQNDEVLIVPAFEISEVSFDMADFPQDKNQLLTKWRDRIIRPFLSKGYFPAYMFTNYSRWMNATEPYKVQWKKSFEPYVIIRKDSSPRFNQTFVGSNYDKSSYIMELQAMRFKFFVLPDVFIVHLPHSRKNQNWFRKMGFIRCARKAHADFIKILERRYNFHIEA